MSTKGRPQNKNLIPFNERTPEEAHAIRSAGGKACQEKRKEKKKLAEMLELLSDLSIKDKRVLNRLKRMGVKEDSDLTNKMLVADALLKAAQSGNTYAIQQYLELIGEAGVTGDSESTNLLEAILESTGEDVNVDDIPEIQQEANTDADLVE